ncbi:MAG: choice-of-anchor Q domain-containing protein, partial [Planctomycetota bacterium]
MRALRLSNLIIVLLVCKCGFAAIRHVPGQYPDIQAAIDSCKDGDVVIVADGVYMGPGNRNIDFEGRAITVRSENGPGGCMIDCQKQGRAFYFDSGEGADSIVSGLTIARGNASSGGGVYCYRSSPTIENCIFLENSAGAGGGVANTYHSNSTVANCVFIGNSARRDGGIHNLFASPLISNCTIVGNRGSKDSGGVGNHGIYGYPDIFEPVITNCVIWGNTVDDAEDGSEQVGIYYNSFPVITYCCIQDWNDVWGGSDNFYSDPLLADNYHLSASSPCIDAGDTNPQYIVSADIDGQLRIDNGRVDVGADEFHVP